MIVGLSLFGANTLLLAGPGASKQLDPLSATFLVKQLKPLLSNSNHHDILRFIVENLYKQHLTAAELESHIGADMTGSFDDDMNYDEELSNPCLEGQLKALRSNNPTDQAAIAANIRNMLDADGFELNNSIRSFLGRFNIIEFSAEDLSAYQKVALFVIMMHADYLFQPEATDYNTAVLNALLMAGGLYDLTQKPSTNSTSAIVHFCQFIKILVQHRVALFEDIAPQLHASIITGLRSLKNINEINCFAGAFGNFRSNNQWFRDIMSAPIEQLNYEAAEDNYRQLITALFAPDSAIRNRGFFQQMPALLDQVARNAFPSLVVVLNNNGALRPTEATNAACPSVLYVILAILLTTVAVGSQAGF